jgi:hypothetical protein
MLQRSHLNPQIVKAYRRARLEMADQGETNSVRLGLLQNPPGRAQDCLRARAPRDEHAAHPLQPEHAQERGGSVLGYIAVMIGCVQETRICLEKSCGTAGRGVWYRGELSQ